MNTHTQRLCVCVGASFYVCSLGYEERKKFFNINSYTTLLVMNKFVAMHFMIIKNSVRPSEVCWMDVYFFIHT